MNKPTLLLAALAVALVGCAPSTTPTEGGNANKEGDTKVAQNAPATNPAMTPDTATPTENPSPTNSATTTTAQGATGAPAAAGGGGGRGGFGGRGGGIAFLVNNDQIKKELNITEEQAKKITALLPQRQEGGGAPGGGAAQPGAGGGGNAPQMTPEERQKMMEERQKERAELEKKVMAVLTSAQKARIKEIQYQTMGTRAFTNEEVVKALGITAEQTKQIEALMPQRGGQGGGGAAAGGGQQMSPEERQKQREELTKKVLAVLTPAQQAKWEKMKGKPFVFQMPQGGGGGGGSMVPK